MLWESRYQDRFDEFNLKLVPVSWAAIAVINTYHFFIHSYGPELPRILDGIVAGLCISALLVHKSRRLQPKYAGIALMASFLIVGGNVVIHRLMDAESTPYTLGVLVVCAAFTLVRPNQFVGFLVLIWAGVIGVQLGHTGVNPPLLFLMFMVSTASCVAFFVRRSSQHQLENTRDELANSLERSNGALRESERLRSQIESQASQLRVITENMTDVVYIYDDDGIIRYVSDSVKSLLGYDPEERIGLSYKESSMTAESVDSISGMFEQALSGNLDYGQVEIQHLTKAGELVWTETRGNTIRNQLGEVEGVCVVVRDITDRRVAEAQLRESEASYRQLSERSIDPILSFDKEGLITYASPSAESIWGIPPEGLVGQPHDMGQTFDSRKRATAAMNRLRDGETTQEDIEVEHVLTDGTHVWSELRVWPIVENEQFAGFQFIARDITDRKATTEQLARQQKRLTERTRELTELNAQLDRFAATVTHDIQAPVRRLLRELESGNSETHNRATTKQKVQYIADLIDHILVTTTYRDALTRTRVDLSKLVRKIVSQQRIETGREVALSLPDPKDGVVNADAKLVELLLENLISNACKFTPTDRDLELQLTVSKNNDTVPTIQLSDNGDGFPVEDPSVLFDFANRAESGQSGFGVGLTTSENIVRRHGGQIKLRNLIAGGACVEFNLGEDSRVAEYSYH